MRKEFADPVHNIISVVQVADADGGAGFSFDVAKQRLGVDGAEGAADAYAKEEEDDGEEGEDKE